MEKVSLASFFAIVLVTGSAEALKVINSTRISEVKVPPPPKEKSGSVVYVYPEKEGREVSSRTPENNISLRTVNATSAPPINATSNGLNMTSTNVTRICYLRLADNNELGWILLKYNTPEELHSSRALAEKRGKKVIEQFCEDEIPTEDRILGSGTIASLAGSGK